MSRPIYYSASPSALDRDGICASQTPSGAGDLTINGALASGGVATMGAAQHVTLYGGSDESGKTFTAYGTDYQGQAISESRAGPNAGTVSFSNNFKTITRVAVSAATAGAVEVGVDGTMETQWFPLNHYLSGGFNVGFGVDITGTMTYTVQHTFEDVFASTFNPATAKAFDHVDVSAKTADADGSYVSPCTAIRLKLSAFTSGSFKFNIDPAA